MTGTGAHLPSGQSGKVDVGPLLFNRLPVCPPNTLREVEGEICLAGSAVTWKVEFWDEVRKLEVVDAEVWVVLGESVEVMNRPFASNVVRKNDVRNSHVLQHRCNDVVRVDVARYRVIQNSCIVEQVCTYRSPRCRSPTPFFLIRECRAHTQATTPEAA
jgi:hypothetical protein